MPKTPHHNFRLGEETIEQIDAIKQHAGMSSRAEVIRVTVRLAFVDILNGKKLHLKKSKTPP